MDKEDAKAFANLLRTNYLPGVYIMTCIEIGKKEKEF